jgi:hypothetical protein
VSSLGKGLAISDEAVLLLDAVVDHFQAAGRELPDRQCVVAGEPRAFAWDCEQLTVSLQGIGWGPAVSATANTPRTGSPASVMSTRHVVLAVTLVRCTPQMEDDGTPPPAAELDAAGRLFMRDAGLLSQAIVTYVSRATQRLDRVASVEAGIVEPIGPTSTHHGLEAVLSITVGHLE